jgi:hypothetical protein
VRAIAFLLGLALGTVLGVLLWPFLVISKEPRPLPGHSWAPSRYGLVDAEYSVTGV